MCARGTAASAERLRQPGREEERMMELGRTLSSKRSGAGAELVPCEAWSPL